MRTIGPRGRGLPNSILNWVRAGRGNQGQECGGNKNRKYHEAGSLNESAMFKKQLKPVPFILLDGRPQGQPGVVNS